MSTSRRMWTNWKIMLKALKIDMKPNNFSTSFERVHIWWCFKKDVDAVVAKNHGRQLEDSGALDVRETFECLPWWRIWCGIHYGFGVTIRKIVLWPKSYYWERKELCHGMHAINSHWLIFHLQWLEFDDDTERPRWFASDWQLPRGKGDIAPHYGLIKAQWAEGKRAKMINSKPKKEHEN